MDNLNDIISSLTSEDIDSLKNIAQSVFGSEEQPQRVNPPAYSTGPEMPFSPDMLMKISSIMARMNGSQDSGRYRLIEALKPNLSKERQKKADEAMQILKILEILPLISELYKGGENNADK